MPLKLLPEKGERTLSVGQTGSGKTAFNVWMLDKMPSAPTIIYDTKIEPKFLTLPHSVLVDTMTDLHNRLEAGEHDYIIFRPPIELAGNTHALDAFLFYHLTSLPGIDAYIDETYAFHSNGRAHRGLTAMLTQGRSRGVSTLMSTQRPVLMSRFALTEAQHIYAFVIAHEDDRKTLNKLIPGFAKQPQIKPETYQFYHYNAAKQHLQKYAPVKLDQKMRQEYTDTVEIEPDADKVRKLTWL